MKKRRTPWPRWAKIMRNLLLFLLFAHMAWALLDKPLPYGAALRRAERQSLFPEAEHSAEISLGLWRNGFRIDWTEDAAMLTLPVRTDGAVLFYFPQTVPHRLTEGTNLLASPWSALQHSDIPGGMDLCAVYIALNPPAESETAALTLYSSIGTLAADAEKENGIFVFYVTPGSDVEDFGWSLPDESPYELEFYDSDGNAIGQIFGPP